MKRIYKDAIIYLICAGVALAISYAIWLWDVRCMP